MLLDTWNLYVWWFNTTVAESLNKIEIQYACIFCLFISGII